VDDDAPFDEIKRAYRSTCKECHPDFMGDRGHNICILLNEAYEVGAFGGGGVCDVSGVSVSDVGR
jgi:hypothetical protein